MWVDRFVPLQNLRLGDSTKLVLCAKVESPDDLVVVKELRPKPELLTPATGAADSLQREFDIATRIQKLGGHEHIVTFEAFHSFAHSNFAIAMEFCADGDLFSFLERQANRRFDEQRALHFFHQAALGVQFLHTNGIAHRDLSLENLLLTRDASELKICDFGLSTDVNAPSTERVGKFNYMAPEVVLGETYCPARADIWSLGIVLFILLTGSPLCEIAEPADPVYDALQHVGVDGILAHWQLHHLFSRDTLELLRDLLQLDPSKRIASADEILARLDGITHL